MKPNLQSNKIIFNYWKKGHTIDQIADSTNIPRGTVRYYTKKFKKRLEVN